MELKKTNCTFMTGTDGWVIDPATDFAKDGMLTALTQVDAVKNIWCPVTPSRSYTAEIRMRITGFGRENGFKLERRDARLMIYFRRDGLSCLGTTGGNAVRVNVTEWNTYKFRVIGNICVVSVNGEAKVAYEMPTWHSDSDRLTVFMRARANTAETKTEIEYVKYTPDQISIDLISPAPRSVLAYGTPITLKAAADSTSVPYVDYFANGTFIGRANAGDGYTMVCENLQPGNYFISAKYETASSVGVEFIVTIDSKDGRVKVSNPTPRLGETVTLSAGTLPADVEKVAFIIDGKEVPSTFTVDFVGKAAVAAKLYCADGSFTVTEPVFITSYAESADACVPLKSNYDIEYTALEGGSLKASDGVYALCITHSKNGIKYITADGEKSFTLPLGSYILRVDSGVCDLYFSGQFALSWRMPITDEKNGMSYSNIEGLRVSGHNADLYTLTDNGGETTTLNPFGYDYAVEFVLDSPKQFSLLLRDGAYAMELTAENGVLTGKTYPNGTAGIVETDIFCTLPEGKHAYRIPVVNGIAQLFIDNLWVYSFRLPVCTTMRCIRFTGIGKLTIRETDDLYTFSDSFDGKAELPSTVYYTAEPGVKTEFTDGAMLISEADKDTDTVLAPSGDYEPKTYTVYLKAYSYDLEADLTVKVDEASEGGIYVVSRHVNLYRNVLAGYNFESGAWEIRVMNNGKLTVAASKAAAFPLGENVSLSFRLRGSCGELLVNGERMLCSDNIDVKFYGTVGVRAEHISASVTYFAYTGTGRPCPGTATFMNAAGSPEIFEYAPGNIYMISGPKRMLESTDDGLTFRYVERPGYHNNTIRLKSGTIVTAHREVVDPQNDTWIDKALVSVDNGSTWEGPFDIQDYAINRITMNNKMTEVSNGRLFLASGESGDGVEGEGGIRVFYSDDEGRSWTGANILALDGKTVISGKNEARMDVHNTDVNCQESRVVEMPDGTLRLYVRTDEGFLYYSLSTDNGCTWTAKMQTSEFITVLSAYNIELDPYTGDYYTAWEYNVKNDSPTIQAPRTRVALAVSRDRMRSWEYVADIDEVATFNNFGHMNIGLKPTKTAVYVDAVKYPPNAEGKTPGCNYAVRVAKDTMKTTARFSKVHSVSKPTPPFVTAEATKNMLLISPDAKEMLLNEKYIKNPDGVVGYVPVSTVSGCIGAMCTSDGSRTKLNVGKSEFVFTAGSAEALVNGLPVKLSAAAVMSGSGILIPTDALESIFGRTAAVTENGTTVSVFDRYGMLDISEIAEFAPWNG